MARLKVVPYPDREIKNNNVNIPGASKFPDWELMEIIGGMNWTLD